MAATATTTTRTVTAAVDTIKKPISTTGMLTPRCSKMSPSTAAARRPGCGEATAGQTVTAGQALATVDTLTMQQTLAQANLTLAKAQATLADDQAALSAAQDALTTAQNDGDDTTAAQAKAATAQQQVTVDQTSITTAQSAVDTAQTALDCATLTSPIDGVVAEVNVSVGKKITGTTSGSSSSAASTGTGTISGGSARRATGGRRQLGGVLGGRCRRGIRRFEYRHRVRKFELGVVCGVRHRRNGRVEGRCHGRLGADRPASGGRPGTVDDHELDRPTRCSARSPRSG